MIFECSLSYKVRGAAIALLAGAGVAIPVHAQIDNGLDTRLRLDQQLQQQRAKDEKQELKSAESLNASDSLVIDGQSYSVSNTVSDMGKALYVSVGRRQWADARRFLSGYERLPGHDPMLMHFAKGGLARSGGDLAEAERQYRALLTINPDFLPGQLEWARVLFENRKDREAKRAFEAIRTRLIEGGQQAQSVLQTVEALLAAFKKRQGWQGSLAVGPTYSDNVNQSSASYTCLLAADDGACVIERRVPDAIKAKGLSFEGALDRRIAISGHHGLRGRAIVFGDIYPDHHDFSQVTSIVRLGYDYQTASNGISIAPSFDLGTLGSSTLYRAWGVNVEWTHILSSRWMARVEANHRDFDYWLPGYLSQNGPLSDASLTIWHVASSSLTLFAGLDLAAKDAPSAVDAYRQWGGRIGANKMFGDTAGLLLIGSYRHRDNRAYSELFEARRSDDIFNATAITRLPVLQFAGLVPEVVLQHLRTRSSIDWLYSYKRTSFSLRLSRAF
jgi:hypothetical protein